MVHAVRPRPLGLAGGTRRATPVLGRVARDSQSDSTRLRGGTDDPRRPVSSPGRYGRPQTSLESPSRTRPVSGEARTTPGDPSLGTSLRAGIPPVGPRGLGQYLSCLCHDRRPIEKSPRRNLTHDPVSEVDSGTPPSLPTSQGPGIR